MCDSLCVRTEFESYLRRSLHNIAKFGQPSASARLSTPSPKTAWHTVSRPISCQLADRCRLRAVDPQDAAVTRGEPIDHQVEDRVNETFVLAVIADC